MARQEARWRRASHLRVVVDYQRNTNAVVVDGSIPLCELKWVAEGQRDVDRVETFA